MSNIIMSTVYNHYMTTYTPRKTDARLDSHNKNELKNIANLTQTANFCFAMPLKD